MRQVDEEVVRRGGEVCTDRLCRVDFYSWGWESLSLQSWFSLGSEQSMCLNISRKTQSVPPARKDTWLSVSFYCAIL